MTEADVKATRLSEGHHSRPNSMKPKQSPTYLAPERLYSLKGFIADSGITPARMSEARRAGITLPTLDVGRRKFVRGADAIAYIERLAGRELLENATDFG